MIEQNEAKKFDSGKPRMELLPTEALNEIAKVLAFGAKKYGDYNWRGGLAWSRLIGAALRHLTAFNDGQDKDPETGLSHLAHAGCCVMFLLEYERSQKDKDDRFTLDENTFQVIIPPGSKLGVIPLSGENSQGMTSWAEESASTKAARNRAP